VREVEEQQLNALSFNETQAKYSEVAGALAGLSGDTLIATSKVQNYGKGVTKSEFADTTMTFMEPSDILITQHAIRLNGRT